MKKLAWVVLASGIWLAPSLVTSRARAENVLVKGAESTGQGWLFSNPVTKHCSVVTAAHVVQGEPDILIVDEDRREGVATNILVLSEKDDVAVMDVSGAVTAKGCLATLGSRNINLPINRSLHGIVNFVALERESTKIPVEITAENGDDHNIISFRTISGNDEINEGYSGTAIVKDVSEEVAPGLLPMPVAMILQVNPNRAIRFDRILSLVTQNASAPVKTSVVTANNLTVSEWVGQTLNVKCGVNKSVSGSDCGWQVQTQNRNVTLVVPMPVGRQSASGVNLEIKAMDTSGALARLYVESSNSAEGDIWTSLKSCAITMNAPMSCRFLSTSTQRLRISVKSSAPIEIKILGLEF